MAKDNEIVAGGDEGKKPPRKPKIEHAYEAVYIGHEKGAPLVLKIVTPQRVTTSWETDDIRVGPATIRLDGHVLQRFGEARP